MNIPGAEGEQMIGGANNSEPLFVIVQLLWACGLWKGPHLKKLPIGHDLVQGKKLGCASVRVIHSRRELDVHMRCKPVLFKGKG